MAPRRHLKLGIKAAVTSVLLALILLVVPWSDLRAGLEQLDRSLWLMVWGVFILGHLASSLKWRLNVNIGRAGLGVTDAVQIYSAGLFANLCLPSIVGGDGLKAALAGRVTGRYESAIFGGLCERLIDTAALMLLAVVGSVLSSDQVEGWGGQVLLVGGLGAMAGAGLFMPLVLRIRLQSWPAKLRRPIGRAMVAMRRLWRRPQLALGLFLMSLSIQSLFVLLNMWLGRGIGIDIPVVFWFLAIPLAKIITLAPISLGGFGLREVTLASLLALVAVPESQGVLVSLLWQTIIVATGLSGGAVWFLLGLRSGASTGGGRDSLRDVARERSTRKAPEQTPEQTEIKSV